MPYIKGASEKVSRILKPFNILVGTKSSNNLRSTLSHVKDRVDNFDKNSVVYKIPCNDCSSCYIGETSRQLHVRIGEHKSYIRYGNDNSQIFQHVLGQNHTFNFNNTSILTQEKNARSRRILEACHTNTTQNTINRAIDIPQSYSNLTQTLLNHWLLYLV